MLAQPILSSPVHPPPAAGRFVRVEYLDFQNVAEHREFRLRAYGPHGSTEYRLRIAIAAFRAGRVRLQDGPDVCYQKVLRAVAAGEMASPAVITIDDVDLARYRDDHTHVPERRPWTDSSLPTAAIVPRQQPRTPSPRLPVAPFVTNHATPPAFEEGQRVSHAVFGIGVTTSSGAGHTVVFFDQDGPKTFVTSMLKLDVLSAPHTWETGPRRNNRLCRAPSRRADAGSAQCR
jgi:hypothetical protein